MSARDQDDNDAGEAAIRRVVIAAMSGSTMKRFAAAAALLIAGKRGRDMQAPEPIIQVGFEPDEDGMKRLVAKATAAQRDLIHVSCHPDGSGKPTGMVATVLLSAGRAHAHRRGGLICEPGGSEVVLAGVSDVEDEIHRFVLRPGRKMIRVGLTITADEFGPWLQQGGELWFERAEALEGSDCDDENLHVFELIDPADERIVRRGGGARGRDHGKTSGGGRRPRRR